MRAPSTSRSLWLSLSLTSFLLAPSILLWVGCALLSGDADLPRNRTIVREQLVIHSDFPLPKQHRLVDEIVFLRGDVYEKLDLPSSDEPIEIYLFDDVHKYRRFLRAGFPELPDRRAFFVESDTQLTVYAHWGDMVAEDLRHEVTHGYLHAVVPAMPIWLDEGLAEYFECPRGQHGNHVKHIGALKDALETHWRPNLVRLESFNELQQMSLRDYAECWLWTHMLLNTTPERLHLLRTYLANLRSNGSAPAISDSLRKLEGDPEQAVEFHLRAMSS